MPTLTRRTLVLSLSALASTALVFVATAGPLDPPPGPITSTAKPLAELEPRTAINAANTPGDSDSLFVISQSGSYYLPANINVYTGFNGIKINNTNALNVTIDLNGFTLRGQPGSLAGIKTASFPGGTSLHIKNGTINSMGGPGMDVYAQAISLSDVSVEFCTPGFNVSGDTATIDHCRAFWNTGDGFNCSAGGVVSNCVAELNTGNGFTLSSNVHLSHCAANSVGLKGVSAGFGCDIADCRLSGGNGVDAVSVSSSCTVERCLITFSTGTGIHATSSKNVIQDNNMSSASPGAHGIVCDVVGNFVVRNTTTGVATPYTLPAGTFAGATVTTAAGVATAGPWSNFAY
jgi:parallel beta-helix repeat protein